MTAAPFPSSLASSKFLGAPTTSHRRPQLSSSRRAVRVSAVRTSAAEGSSPAWATAAEPPASLYNVLGIEPGATSQEIKSAYRSLARTCHPDVAAKNVTADEFMRVHAAYATLSDADKRADYDRKLITLKWQRRWQTRSRDGPLSFSSSPSSSSARSPSFSGHGQRSWETDQCW